MKTLEDNAFSVTILSILNSRQSCVNNVTKIIIMILKKINVENVPNKDLGLMEKCVLSVQIKHTLTIK